MGRPPWALLTAFSLCAGQMVAWAERPEIPPELLEDHHFREEFGINELTTPSIERIFEQLESLGDLPEAALRRDWPERIPTQRERIALDLGGLIADGFFLVEAERLPDLDAAGRAIVKHASALGAGLCFAGRTKALVEHGQRGEWALLEQELAATQRDVERELILLRDVEVVHLIALGGWLRALDMACTVLEGSYSPERAEVLRRVDIADYYLSELGTFHPRLRETPVIQALRRELRVLRDLLEIEDHAVFSRERVASIHAAVRRLDDAVSTAS